MGQIIKKQKNILMKGSPYEALQDLGHNLNPTPNFADTSRSLSSTSVETSMSSRGAEIVWCLKQLFSSQFWPQTANFNLSKTQYFKFL